MKKALGIRAIAHRGGVPENSLSMLIACLQPTTDAYGIECDVQFTKDGIPVVFHDHDTKRLTGKEGTIVDRTWTEVCRLRSLGEPIATLDELGKAIAELQPSHRLLNIEFKPTARVRDVLTAASRFRETVAPCATLEVVFSSFDPRVVYAMLRHQPDWPVAYLYEDLAALEALAFFPTTSRPIDLHPHHNLLTAGHIEEYGQADRMFRTWTVDEPAEARRILALGIEHIITNDPSALINALKEKPSE